MIDLLLSGWDGVILSFFLGGAITLAIEHAIEEWSGE